MKDAMAVIGLKSTALWLTTFALATSAQVAEYTQALMLARNAGEDAGIDALERLTEKEPEFLQSYQALVAITRRAGKPHRAEQHFESLLASPRAMPYAHYALAAYYNAHQEHARAEEHALECLKLLPHFIAPYGELAKAASDPALRSRISKLVDDQRQARPHTPGPLYASAVLHMDERQWTEAIPLLVKADELAPGTWEILDALFQSYYQTDQSASTLTVLDRELALSRQRNDTEREGMVLGRIGMVQSDLGEYDEARSNLEKAVEIMRELGAAQFEQAYQANLGNTLLLTGRYADALAHLEQALAIARKTGDRQNEGRDVGLIALVHLDGRIPLRFELSHRRPKSRKRRATSPAKPIRPRAWLSHTACSVTRARR